MTRRTRSASRPGLSLLVSGLRAGAPLLIGLLSGACAQHRAVPLMPTPTLYTALERGPLDHVPEHERWKPRRVYFATTRERTSDVGRIDYGNREGDGIAVGLALVGFGGPDVTWSDLQRLSRLSEREREVDLSIAGLIEAGRVSPEDPGPAAWLVADLNEAVAAARDPDLLIYVHGARVDFYNACAFAAQLDHFMGRDLTSLAFAWPTRQNLLAYGLGDDVERAYRAADELAGLLELLAERSVAERIHVVCWSAGGRVVSSALETLRARHADLEGQALRARTRIGTVYFAAADVPGTEFVERLPAIDAVAERVVVTASTNDGALVNARRLMGGDTRTGTVRDDLAPEDLEVVLDAERLEVIDVSRGAGARGFDISGHRYWYDHPWASSDLILAVRSQLRPAERALEPTELPLLWVIPPDYPQRLASLPVDGTRDPETPGP